MKRVLTLLIALMMLTGLFAAAFAEEISIKVVICEYSDHTTRYMNNILEAYTKIHPEVKVDLEMVSWDDVGGRISTLIAGKQAPDILNIDAFSQYLEDELLLPAAAYTSEALSANLYKTFYENNADDEGTIYALPMLATVRSLYYSKDIFNEVGISKAPETWSELEEVCQKILDYYDGAIYPWGITFSTHEGQATFAYYTWNNGGGFINDDGEWILNSKENVEAVNFMTGLVEKGYCNANPQTESRDDLQAIMVNGKIAMMISANFFPGLYLNFDLGVAPIPRADSQKNNIQLGVQDFMMVFDNNDSDEKLAAIRDFLDVFYSDEIYPDWMNTEGMLPATMSGMEKLAVDNEFFTGYLEQLKSAKFFPTNKLAWKTAQYAVIEAVQNVAAGTMDAQTALDIAQADVLDD